MQVEYKHPPIPIFADLRLDELFVSLHGTGLYAKHSSTGARVVVPAPGGAAAGFFTEFDASSHVRRVKSLTIETEG